MTLTHSLGFPRIGAHREMKFAVEAYWKGELVEADLIEKGRQIRQDNWAMQSQLGLHLLPVGDFSWYDHVLDMSVLLGVIPKPYQWNKKAVNLATYFKMARGGGLNGQEVQACEMTKWFDTNYHYIVPELDSSQTFSLNNSKLFDEIKEAHLLGYQVKPILLGPLSYLWLSKTYSKSFNKLTLLPDLIETYKIILSKLQSLNIQWVQIDEPILVLDLPKDWQMAFANSYDAFQTIPQKLLLTTYFGGLEDNLNLTCNLPVAGIHIDAHRAPEQVPLVLKQLRKECILSLGVVNGRNIWKTNLQEKLQFLKPIHQELGDRLWLSGSCSFLHSPVDLELETRLNPEIKQWLAFAKQKTLEIVQLSKALKDGEESIKSILEENNQSMKARQNSILIHNPIVKKQVQSINELTLNRSPYSIRHTLQNQEINLSLFPTTTIGSFPQTSEIRHLRRQLKNGTLSIKQYESKIKQQIKEVIEKQEKIGLDVLVHGESERNDMVEYFGELLEGFAFTQNGWIQSYGSRCVKPPIIYGDVLRPQAMTVKWSSYAQSLTDKPVKGMLTGPMTMLLWSFVRDDQPIYETAQQIALVLREEVKELEQAGIKMIQIDEPAFREGLPLRRHLWSDYLKNAVHCFKLASTGVNDKTQIHTHMCYSEFNDIIEAIAEMDADVISIETSRSHMELMEAFKAFSYPNEIGPGVYDIHSPRVPSVNEMVQLIEKAAQFIPPNRLWINPDCGLKTRSWQEVEASLINMIEASRILRAQFSKKL